VKLVLRKGLLLLIVLSLSSCLALADHRPSEITPPIFVGKAVPGVAGVFISKVNVPPEVLVTYDIPVTIVVNNTGPAPVWNISALVEAPKALQVYFQPPPVRRLEGWGWTTMIALIHPLKEGIWNITVKLYVGGRVVDEASVTVRVYSVFTYAQEHGVALPPLRKPSP